MFLTCFLNLFCGGLSMEQEKGWIVAGSYFVCDQTGEKVDVPEGMTADEVLSLLLRGERP
jgi:hypothetical protein